MRCAVVEESTGKVLNIIMADPEVDDPEIGTILVVIPDGHMADHRWTWTDADGFTPHDQQLIVEQKQMFIDRARVKAQTPYLLDE